MKDRYIKHYFRLTMGGQFSWYLAKYIRSEARTIVVKILEKYHDTRDDGYKKGEELSIDSNNFYTVNELVGLKDKLFPMLFSAVGGNQ